MEHLRILVVDDHEIVRSLLRHLLEAESGWEVCGEASDGEEAVERSKALHPDIVVMDAVKPRRNGFEARRSCGYSEMVFASGHRGDGCSHAAAQRV